MSKWRPIKVMAIVEVFLVAGFLVAGWLAVQPGEPVVIVAADTTTTLTAAPPQAGTDPTSPIGTVTGTTFQLITTPPITVDPVTTATDPTTTFTAPVTLTVAEQLLIAATNDLRIDLALPTVSVDATLQVYAGDWAMHMAVVGAVSHSDIEVLLDGWTVIGENVVEATTAESAFQALVNSPSHYEVIANPAFTEIGVGAVLDGKGQLWISQVFAGDLLPTTTLPELIVTTTSVTLPEVTIPTLP